MRPVNRPMPAAPAATFATYRLDSPLSTHWQPATCEQVGCGAWLNGWATDVDESTGLGAAQAAYIRRDRSRGHIETRLPAGLTRFTFGPGNRCFAASKHRRRLDRPEIYTVRSGDWRDDFGLLRRHTRPADWVDDFATHQQHIADHINRG